MTVADNIAAVEAKMTAVKSHCMCAKFEDDGRYFRVIYPLGDFPVDGVQASYAEGKAVALDRLLPIMERHWTKSFPGAA